MFAHNLVALQTARNLPFSGIVHSVLRKIHAAISVYLAIDPDMEKGILLTHIF